VSRGSGSSRLAAWLALDRNTAAAAGAVSLMALGEQLWRRFLPKYLEVLGAPVIAIGVYGSTQDLLDGLYQYPGGWLSDRLGRRRALLGFVAMAAGGYALIAIAQSWPLVLLGMAGAMAWSSMASPSLFAVIGDALPPERRAVGFAVQSIVRRIPISIAPTMGGLLIAAYGVLNGVRIGLIAAIATAMIAFLVIRTMGVAIPISPAGTNLRGVWGQLPTPLRRLLLSDICIRTCEGMVDVFLVLYALNVVGIAAPQFGLLVAVQMATSIAAYLPASRWADRLGRKPFVIATFLAFSTFPIAVGLARSFMGLVAAFVIGGLREIGEPARKALIVDLIGPAVRGRGVGLYYLIRSITIAPAAIIGGVLWGVSPWLTFGLAALVGFLGTAIFALGRTGETG
jgi:MFS family permease